MPGDPWESEAHRDTQSSMCDLFSAYKEQERLFQEWTSMKKDIGKAKAIKEIATDYRKKILSRLKYPFVKDGDSDASADTKARALDLYDKDLAQHASDIAEAEEVLDRKEWIKARLESLRTTISTERELIGMK